MVFARLFLLCVEREKSATRARAARTEEIEVEPEWQAAEADAATDPRNVASTSEARAPERKHTFTFFKFEQKCPLSLSLTRLSCLLPCSGAASVGPQTS